MIMAPPHRLGYLNIWSPVGKVVWKGLENVALLEEMCEGGMGGRLWFQRTCVFPIVSLSPCRSRCELSATAPDHGYQLLCSCHDSHEL
ncbi:rCG26389 [Rattus norvegicus]|uniref:RCG26389 n=1 Tax=Rattus norvegicus TaxID=10116 RepID=A6HQE5_RAT|nr:rCG26389 [Rattus norvegicus]